MEPVIPASFIHLNLNTMSSKDKKYKVSKARILEVSQTCSKAKEILEGLFPEAFEEEMKIPIPFIFRRAQYNNVYAVVISTKDGFLDIINLSTGGKWTRKCNIDYWTQGNRKYIYEEDLRKLTGWLTLHVDSSDYFKDQPPQKSAPQYNIGIK